MIRAIPVILMLMLSACDGPGDSKSIASSLIGGFAGGVGAGAGHAAVSAGIDKYRRHKEAKAQAAATQRPTFARRSTRMTRR